jgi:signal transduction histidine kinase
MLHVFLHANRERIIGRAGALMSAQPTPGARAQDLGRGLPVFMDQVIETLVDGGVQDGAIGASASLHGALCMKAGFNCREIVREYGNLCQAITELADQMKESITVDEFRTLNQCLDNAIAGAITEYARLREEAIDQVETGHLGALARELHQPLTAAVLTYQVLKTGAVAMGGSTGTQLGRNLRRVSAIIDRTMARVRLDAGGRSPERVSVFAFIEELEVGAALEANARGLFLSVSPGEPGVAVWVDRQLLTAAISNLLQNALQFTKQGGHVTLKASCPSDRVRIEVADECGGLPPGVSIALAGGPARQGASAPPALGPGLSVVRRSVEAIGGELGVRDLPPRGCAFTLDLQRQSRGSSNVGPSDVPPTQSGH